ncbi:helix-turn-helix transcriptional regulator [Bradyrhizobium sp. CCH5-F6]|jgi:transcriptional regulator with XRE-family HTH domain|uniref:helix-turn-helix domain-containing protein n=1 Tax=Bradyrhizobium sp. CCH5-F6 TaxID=1768753 RepID=UPI00076A2A77|nr:helix-turn-helix transcriptional regulator [Bradyrhizobium sp. CCH5-F6]
MPVMTKTPQGDDIVILSRAEYDALTMGRRDEDAADAARANGILADIEMGTEILLSSEQASELLEAKTPLAFWRKHRGMTQEALSKSVGVAQGFISEIENGAKTGDVQTLALIARALGVSLDDLVIPMPVKSSKQGSGKARMIRATSSKGRGRARSRATKRKVKSPSA